jgi:hypothetical protein
LTVWGRKVSHEVCVVVVCDCAWVVYTEGVEGVCEGYFSCFEGFDGVLECEVGGWDCGSVCAGAESEKGDVIYMLLVGELVGMKC